MRNIQYSKFHIPHSKNGQVLVEAIIAISVLVTAFLGIFALMSRSLQTNRVVADNYIAAYLAAEGIEVVKNLLDKNAFAGTAWNAGFSTNDFEVEYSSDSLPLPPYQDRNLSFNASAKFYGYGGGIATNFKRRIRITLVGADEMRVNSIVSRSRGPFGSSVNLEDRFFNWRR